MWDPDGVPADAIERGAYVLKDADGEPGADPDGHRAPRSTSPTTRPKILEAEGVKVRLVSMPCLDRFAEQDQAYRDSVLPPAVRARVAVEAASPLGWHRWVGDAGDVVAMEGFGASAPGEGALQALRVHGRERRRARPGVLGRSARGIGELRVRE